MWYRHPQRISACHVEQRHIIELTRLDHPKGHIDATVSAIIVTSRIIWEGLTRSFLGGTKSATWGLSGDN
ncbi:MAG: hypothetical protein BECKG1743D_GA0114223_109201, partial [Candidatus Kentron sp. G]